MAAVKAGDKITPMLWYESGAEDAAKFYVSIFKKSKVLLTTHYPRDSQHMPGGSVMTKELLLQGQKFTLINGGAYFKMTGAVSFFVHCKDQKEIDHYWSKLVAGGGEHLPCGWLKDRWGVHWQIVPADWRNLLHGKDKKKSARAFQALMGMKKISIQGLKDAYNGK